jgi:radical SAM protein with 4Fe4S-binding SPASM domain
LMAMRKKNNNIVMTTKLLKAIRNFYLTGERTWKCRAFQNFFIIDHVGRVAGCHVHDPMTTIFDLPKMWRSSKLKALRRKYSGCTQCTYMCYIFYSLHGSVLANLEIAQEQWKNARLFLKRMPLVPL